MARLKTAAELEQERLETLQKLTGNYPIEKYTKRPALVYSRYSTARQVRDSIAAGLQQSEKLLQRADDLGWERSLLTLLVENQMTRDGRIRSVSGTVPIEDRAGMQVVIDGVKAGAGAIICDDISRLTRDADLVDATSLAKTCKEHDCIIVTSERVYNFKCKADFDAYIDEARAAASFLETHIRNKMLKNRSRKAEQGKLANGVAPIGLMRDETGDNLKPSPHAPRVDWLYARFRAHNASLNSLLREIFEMARRNEPVFPVVDGIDPKTIYLSEVRRDGKPDGELLGWSPTSRSGLQHILTSPFYQGHIQFNQRIVKYNAFPSIVNSLNWQYAHDLLADVDLDGQPIERPEKMVRYVQKDRRDSGALLAGTRHNGTPVIDGVDGAHVYVELSLNIYALMQLHRLKGSEPVTGYETSITTSELDHIFEEHLLNWLVTSEVASSLGVKELVTGFPNAVAIPTPQVYEMAYSVNSTENTAIPPDNTMETLNSRIEQLEYDLRHFNMDETDRGWAYEQLGRLRTRRAKIEQAREQQAQIQAEIKEAASDVCLACTQWHGWKLERKRRLIRLVTESITLEEPADGWLRLSITWSPVLGGLTEYCYIWRATGSQWSQADVERLSELYPTASKSELLRAFPTRSWHAIQRRAIVSKVRRTVIDRDVTIPLDTSLSDYEVVQRHGVEPGKRVQWLRGTVGKGVFPS